MIERRENLGTGWEHEVFKSRVEGWVLKRPKLATVALLRLFYDSPSEVLRQETEFHSERFKQSGIKFPETRIFAIGRGYIIAQRIVEEDDSLKPLDMQSKLEKAGDQYLIDLYQRDPSNFRCNNGDLYCLDLTFGFNRYPKKLGIMSVEHQKHLTSKLSQLLSMPTREVTVIDSRQRGKVQDVKLKG